MARTRARQATAGPQSQLQRPRLARRSKPSQPLLESSDSEGDQNDRSDLSIASESDSEDDPRDAGIDRSMGDLDIHAIRSRPAKRLNRGRGRPSKQSTTRAKRGRPSKSTSKPASQTPRGRKRGRPPTASTPSKKSRTEPAVTTPGIIPNWLDPRLPYAAWIDIFTYAAMDAPGGHGQSWLVIAASTCKAFLEPAMKALYRCPAPSSANKAKRLAAHLKSTAGTMVNYRAMVESLYIDADFFSPLAMAQLAVCLPRLWELVPFTRFDQPPYRELDRAVRWGHSPAILAYLAQPLDDEVHRQVYPESDEFSTLRSRDLVAPVILKSWEWSGRLLAAGGMTVDNLIQLHESATFEQLTRISFTNFQIPSLKRKSLPTEEIALQAVLAEDERIIDTISYSIAKLTKLKHLVFESSTVVGGRLLDRLPKDLIHLQLINCWEVTSEDFTMFLSTHGSHLRFLTLNHNQSLDLAFLTELAIHCPNLEELRINMSYYRLHDTVNDSDPMYEEALLPGQMPLWPSSLQLIDVDHVRQWSVEASETFLASLINSAPNLPALRHLTFKTMLDVPWQRRAEMRQVWREKFDAVFLRPWVSPKVHTSLQQDDAPAALTSDMSPRKRRKRSSAEPSRRSGRIAAHSSDSDRHSSRLRRHSKPRYIDPDTDADELSSEAEERSQESQHHSADEDSAGEPKDEPLPVQGLCETVDIMFDNQKARELQWGMEDFEDDHESSGDEWNGDNDFEDDTYAW